MTSPYFTQGMLEISEGQNSASKYQQSYKSNSNILGRDTLLLKCKDAITSLQQELQDEKQIRKLADEQVQQYQGQVMQMKEDISMFKDAAFKAQKENKQLVYQIEYLTDQLKEHVNKVEKEQVTTQSLKDDLELQAKLMEQ